MVDLRGPRTAILEKDRRLAHPTPDLLAPEQDLLQVGVAAGPDAIQVELGQLRDAIAAERAAVVPRPQAEQEAGIPVDARAHQLAFEVEAALDPAPPNIARADHDVVVVHPRQERRDEARRVAEVGVEVE